MHGRAGDATTRRQRRAWRRSTAAAVAAGHGGVVHRGLLREAGITDTEIRSELRAERWVALGRHTLFLGDLSSVRSTPELGPPTLPARLWWAVWESGGRAALDGVSALLAAGLSGWDEDTIHVTLPRNCRVNRLPGVRPHVHREVMPVQQRLVPAERVLRYWCTVKRSPRRAVLAAVIRDVCDGAQSLGELDFASACRRYGLPPPTRQQVRTTASGRVYLDVWWEHLGVGVEIEGAHHTHGLNAVDDALRQNDIVLDDGVILRLPVLGFRLLEERFMRQVEQGLRAAARQRGVPLLVSGPHTVPRVRPSVSRNA